MDWDHCLRGLLSGKLIGGRMGPCSNAIIRPQSCYLTDTFTPRVYTSVLTVGCAFRADIIPVSRIYRTQERGAQLR